MYGAETRSFRKKKLNKLRIRQRDTEKNFVEIILKYRKTKTLIRPGTKTEYVEQVISLKWQWTGNIAEMNISEVERYIDGNHEEKDEESEHRRRVGEIT